MAVIRKAGQQLNVTVPASGSFVSNFFNVTGAEEIIFLIWGGADAADEFADILSFNWSVDGINVTVNGIPAAGTSSPAAGTIGLGPTYAAKGGAAIVRILKVANSTLAAVAPFVNLVISATTNPHTGVNIECYGVYTNDNGSSGHVMG